MIARIITTLVLLLAALDAWAQPVRIEAERFTRQALAEKRQWHVSSAQHASTITPGGSRDPALTYNAGGDGDNVWPFVERDATLHYDCSKLDPWGIVFDHDVTHQQRAVEELEKALGHWKRLAELGARFNQSPVLSSSRAPFSWAALTPAAEKGIELAKAPLASTNLIRKRPSP